MEKIKQFVESDRGRGILTVLIMILIGLGSFELGRLSKLNDIGGIKILPSPISTIGANTVSAIESTGQASKTTVVTKNAPAIIKNFVASKKGTKYYPVGCAAGNSLKIENRIYFDTRAEAEGAGYELSGSCR